MWKLVSMFERLWCSSDDFPIVERFFLSMIAYWANEDRYRLHSSNRLRPICFHNWNNGRKWIIWNTLVLLTATNKDTTRSVSSGVLGSFTVIMYGYLIFWLFGLPFTFYPLLASILSMTLPLYNDYKMHSHRSQGIKEIDNLHPIIAEEAKALATGSFASIIGSFVGIALGLIYFLR